MKNGVKPGPVKLPLDTRDALRALLQVKPPMKATKGKKKPRKPKKS